MRKYIASIVITALLTSGLLLLGIHTNPSLGSIASPSDTAQLSKDLAANPDFLSSVRSELSSTTSVKGDKGDKGDTGMSGTDGSNGGNGSNGTAGSSGTNGANGSAGVDGASGSSGINGLNGANGATGATGATGLQGPKGDTGATGATGVTGAQGQQGIQGVQGVQGIQGTQGVKGDTGLVNVAVSGLTYDASAAALSLTAGYAIPLASAISNWNTAYSWGNSALAGYAVQAGVAGGQTLTGGTAANQVLTLQGNAATTGNTATNAAIQLKVGNSGSIIALTVLNSGNVGIGTATPGSKLTIAGDVAITTTGTDVIKPFQFMQVTGLGDNPTLTSFNGTSYSSTDWSPAVIGFSNGGACGTTWTGGALTGMKYWWDTSGGNWRLTIDMSGPNDGCNSVQVMFVRKEFANRVNY